MSGAIMASETEAPLASASTSAIASHQPPAIVVTDVIQMSELTGRKVEPWEVAFFNGGAILDEIPIQTRDTTEQIAFREPRNTGAENSNSSQVRVKGTFTLSGMEIDFRKSN